MSRYLRVIIQCSHLMGYHHLQALRDVVMVCVELVLEPLICSVQQLTTGIHIHVHMTADYRYTDTMYTYKCIIYCMTADYRNA